MGNFSDQFKNESLKQTIGGLRKKYQPQDVKQMSQNDIIKTLEMEKSLEKDDKTRANYDTIIKAVKEFFAKKFNEAKSKAVLIEKSKDALLAQKALECLARHQELEAFAKQVLGAQFVENLKKDNAYVRSQSSGWVKKLS